MTAFDAIARCDFGRGWTIINTATGTSNGKAYRTKADAAAVLDRATVANAAASARILAHIDAGLAIGEAVDAVLGAGEYDAFVTSLYNALREVSA